MAAVARLDAGGQQVVHGVVVDRLVAAGVNEGAGERGWVHRKHKQFELAQLKGRPIEVDLAFPPEFSDEECQAVIDRIKHAFD